MSHASALKSLQREHKKHLEREQQLGDILDALRKGYNPNYQDMAVLEAVRGWEYLAKLPHIGVEEDAQVAADLSVSDEEAGIEEGEEEKKEEEVNEDDWTEEDLKTGLDDLLNTDYVSLLMAHDEHVLTPPSGSREYTCPLFRLILTGTSIQYALLPSGIPHATIRGNAADRSLMAGSDRNCWLGRRKLSRSAPSSHLQLIFKHLH